MMRSFLTPLVPWQAVRAGTFCSAKRTRQGLGSLTILLLLGGLPALAAAATLHVDQNNAQCTDAGAGTQQEPFCTISAAAAQVGAGDTVVVRPGTYDEEVVVAASGTESAPIVFAADTGVTVTGQSHGFDLSGDSWITLQGFTISATTGDAIRALLAANLTISGNRVIDAGGTGIEVRDCGDVMISDNEVQESTDPGVFVKFCSNVTVTGNYVTGAGQPISGQNEKGIVFNGSADVEVSNNLTEANSDAGIYVSNDSTGIHITSNTTRHNAREYTRAAAGIDLRGSIGNTIEANISHDNEDSGINVRNGAADNLVVNNLAYNNGDHGIDFLRAPNGRIIGNTVYGNFKHGLEIEGDSVGMTVANNICVDNGEANIRTAATSVENSTADYNIVYLTSPGAMYEWGGVAYATLDDMRAANPGLEINGIEADPLWVAPESGDFHLNAGSPAIDSADSGKSGALAYDLEGNGRLDDSGTTNTGVGPRPYDDRGAFEFQGTSPSNAPPEIVSGPTATPNPLSSDETAELAVTATDPDGNPLDYNWSVSLGGGSISGTGPRVTYLPPAVTETQIYTVTVEVTDSFGALAEGSVEVTVEPAPHADILSFLPTADAWVDETLPDMNQGGSKRLNVDGSAIETSFLRFEVTGLTAPVQYAWLEFTVYRASVDGGTLHAVADNSWGEFTLTYNNQPVYDSDVLATVGAVSKDEILQLDVTQAIDQDGEYSFAIVGNGRDGWAVRSREDPANTPRLFIAPESTP
jgi:parallel beta-helix repeat protein